MQTTDFLVLGSGIAGLVYALDVADYGKVTVLCKGVPLEGNTRYAQGGIASVIDPADTFESHIADTEVAGAGLCNHEIVGLTVREGPVAIEHLIQLGAQFDTVQTDGTLALGREGGHSYRRIVHSRDATGEEIERALYERALAHPNITFLDHTVAIDFITRTTPWAGTEVIGVFAFDKASGQVDSIASGVTMLATGGAGKVYIYTSNPDVATGDGIAMAFRAGARVANMEFVQFHPTCLFHPRAKSFLITEAMRGEGALLKNAAGEQFMPRYHELRELAPRDIVARAIDHEMKSSGADCVYLDISHRSADFVRGRFPTIYAKALEFGIDITATPIPVVPAAHYCCGGVVTDSNGRTDLTRLYAAGEVACTGLHGANRLASNSLLEAVVFARRAAADTVSRFSKLSPVVNVPVWDHLDTVRSTEEVIVAHIWDEVRRLTWNLVGVVRSNNRLRLARRRMDTIREDVRNYYYHYRVTADLLELRNIIDVAQMIIACAELRRESRGLHFNIDYPEREDGVWIKDTILKR
jgi:L-aspartate oxidase